MRARLAVVCLVLSIGACGASEEDARSWYAARKASIDAIDREIRAHAPPRKPDCTHDADALGCEAKWDARLGQARERLADEVLPSLLGSSGALGIEVFQTDEIWSGRGTVLASVGASVNSLSQGTSEQSGVQIEGRWLGWGKYSIDAPEGSQEPIEGFAVAWMADDERGDGMSLRVRVLFAAP